MNVDGRAQERVDGGPAGVLAGTGVGRDAHDVATLQHHVQATGCDVRVPRNRLLAAGGLSDGQLAAFVEAVGQATG